MKHVKSIVKIAFLTLFVVSALTVAVSAEASTVTVRNSLDKKLSLAFCYTDKTSGSEVTKGWWYIEPGAETAVTLDADESKPVYYAAFNKDLYSDASTVKDAQVKSWLSYKMFTYDADVEPADTDVFESKFFRCPEDGTVDINADSRGRPQ
ncbi:MAG: DUF1036 domain-containing protein [Synergistaceae bacterium]|jgi:uncharacterized membrane protein|nr:DUF1036 domain-containing protein [Synergistaceae bacterium]